MCGLLKFFAMGIFVDRLALKRFDSLLILMLCTASLPLHAQAPTAPSTSAAAVPEWAQPGSPTHVQVPPPADFHRPSRNFDAPIGVFEGQSDIGAAVVPGGANYDASTKQYTINSAGYNIWYSRDEFRYLWKKMSGDVSLAADVTFPDPKGYGDRKAVLVIRQSLDDDSREAMIGEHGAGMIHLAWRPNRGASMKDAQFRFGGTLAGVKAKRIGIEKHGDSIAIFISLEGEPMHQLSHQSPSTSTNLFTWASASARTCPRHRTLLCSPTSFSRTRRLRCSRSEQRSHCDALNCKAACLNHRNDNRRQ